MRRRPQIARALRPRGVVFLTTHQTFKLHGYPFDYFRFSTRALEALFEPALGVDVNASWYEHEAMYVGDPNAPKVFHPHTPVDAPNAERSWIIVSIFATKRARTPAWTDEYPYLVDSEDT